MLIAVHGGNKWGRVIMQQKRIVEDRAAHGSS